MKCSHPQTPPFTLCSRCHELVVPPEDSNYFEIFGISPRYVIDEASLKQRFYALSRNLHPDKFHSVSEEALIKATHWFAVVNKALTTLRNDVDRAQYLFKLAHFEPQNSKNALPPDLAEDYFTLQESLEEDVLPPAEKKRQLEEFAAKIREKIIESDAKREAAFIQWQQVGSPLDQRAAPFFEKAAREINQGSYLNSMAEDLEKKCRM